jgi:hypothetical protein
VREQRFQLIPLSGPPDRNIICRQGVNPIKCKEESEKGEGEPHNPLQTAADLEGVCCVPDQRPGGRAEWSMMNGFILVREKMRLL